MFRSMIVISVISLCLMPCVLFCASDELEYTFKKTEKGVRTYVKVFGQMSKDCHIGIVILAIDKDKCMEILSVEVDEAYRGNGLGGALLQSALSIAQEWHCTKIKLTACPDSFPQEKFDADLLRLEKWYQRFGFKSLPPPEGYDEIPMETLPPYRMDVVLLPRFS